MIEVPLEEEPERAALAFFAWRFSFSDLLVAVFEDLHDRSDHDHEKKTASRREPDGSWSPIAMVADDGLSPLSSAARADYAIRQAAH